MKSQFSIAELAEALQVSRSGYYAWRQRQAEPGSRSRQNTILLAHIRAVFEDHQQRYGSPRVFHSLRQQGLCCGHNRIARLMRLDGLRARRKRPFRPRTTEAGSNAAPNLLRQAPPPIAPNQVWVADITYLWTEQGWLYLAAIMDLYSRRIVGWHAADHLRGCLAEQALQEALRLRRPKAGLLHHSDRGWQYASDTYGDQLASCQARRSMSRRAVCYDNAAMEAFWSSLKNELIYAQSLLSRQETIAALFDYIELYYNRRRLHSALGYQSPVAFETTATPQHRRHER